MSLGTKWIIEIETNKPIGDCFLEGVLKDGIGEDDDGHLVKSVKVNCLKECTNDECNEIKRQRDVFK